MVSVKEIMLGSMLSRYGEHMEVNDVNMYGSNGQPTINGWEEDEFEPIQLTHELLEKYGFKKVKGKSWKYEHDECPNNILVGSGIYMNNVTPEIKALHQLQNIFFFVTGKELTLNQ